jgi:formate dehydrogenase major subunit
VPGLGTSFGRGGATTFQQDLQNADCVVIEGSNMAEAHPIAFRFVMQAKERGATIIHVDPRFTRTSALADVHVPIRAGTDIAWLGGLIHYMLEHDLYFKDYVLAYTNAATLINPAFQDTEDLDGLFAGYDAERRKYDSSAWQYQTDPETGAPLQDPTLEDPNCVLNILKRHYSRYTSEKVADTTGIPADLLQRVATTLADNSGRERTSAFCYAVGWTQHTVGVQIIRAASVLQLLLGNIGRPGGGIMALRGHASIQGSTDIPTLYHLLPGYLPMPDARTTYPATSSDHGPGSESDVEWAPEAGHATLQGYISTVTKPTGWWVHTPAYIISLLKAWYGDAATDDNDFAYHLVPKITGNHSQLPMTLAMKDGEINGLIVMGQNPAVGGHNTGLVREGLANLDWLVVRDFFEIETASFWYDSPEIEEGRLRVQDIKTEVFFLPAAGVPEKDGTFTNTQRLLQWHAKAVYPPRDARSEPWFVHQLAQRLKQLYAQETGPAAEQIKALTWDYPQDETGEPDAEAILREINGYTWPDRQQICSFTKLKDDGSTACGCWIYTGVYPEPDVNRARANDADDYTSLRWGFAWPANRRMLYNRASADPDGNPWSERKKYVWWDAEVGEWTGYDVPDFPRHKPPDAAAEWEAGGMAAHSGSDPFIMMTDGKGWLFVPEGLDDGPLPAHYEPAESPVHNPLYRQQVNPVADFWRRPDNPYHEVGDPRYPYVITTYRLTEHHTAGGRDQPGAGGREGGRERRLGDGHHCPR